MGIDLRYGDLTYEEIRDRARQGWLAIVPTGCTEQQGPHLPVDFDSLMLRNNAYRNIEEEKEHECLIDVELTKEMKNE